MLIVCFVFHTSVQLIDLVKCEHAIDHFAKTETTFKAVSQQILKIKEAIKILKVPFDATKSIQKAEFTLSDFYGTCIVMRETLKILTNKQDKKTDLATILLEEFEKRHSKMLRNQAMFAAVYLDRRFSADLNEYEVELAKLTLCNLWERVKNSLNRTEVRQDPVNADYEDETFNFEAYFRLKGVVSINFNTECGQSCPDDSGARSSDGAGKEPNYQMTKSQLILSLDSFEHKFPIISHKTSIIPFWEEQKQNFPEIFELATILFAIPPSQATVERSFSQFGFVFSCRRCHIQVVTATHTTTQLSL